MHLKVIEVYTIKVIFKQERNKNRFSFSNNSFSKVDADKLN